MSVSTTLSRIGSQLAFVGIVSLIGMSTAAATKLELVLLSAGGAKPSKVLVRPEGGTEVELREPWIYDLPAIPIDQWQSRFDMVISWDTTQSNDKPTDIEIPIRFTRYHAQDATLRLPIHILSSIEKFNDTFYKQFEQKLSGESEIVKSYFMARYSWNRLSDRTGATARRILFAYLEAAQAYSSKYAYAPVGDVVVDLVDKMLDAPDPGEQSENKKKFSYWTRKTSENDKERSKAIREVSGLDQLRYEAWTDLRLWDASRSNPRSRPLNDIKDRCILASYYVGQFDNDIQSADVKQTITNFLGFKSDSTSVAKDGNWARIRTFIASCSPPVQAKP